MASGVVGSLLVKLGAATADFDRAMTKSADKVKGFENTVGKTAAGTAIGIGITKGLGMLQDAAQSALSAFLQIAAEMDNVVESADKFGVDVRSFLTLDVVARESATSIETVGKAIQKMKENIGKGKISGELGFSTKQLKGLGTGGAFEALAKKIAAIQDPIERARIETELFGKSGAELDGVIRNLSNGFEAWKDQIPDPEAVENIGAIGDTLEKIERQAKNAAIGGFGILAKEYNRWIASIEASSGKLETLYRIFSVLRGGVIGSEAGDRLLAEQAKIKKNMADKKGMMPEAADLKESLKIIEKMKDELATFGMSDSEKERRKLVKELGQSGASDKETAAILSRFDALAEEYDWRNAAEKEFKELVEETNKAIQDELDQYDRAIERGIELAKHADPLAEYADKMKNLRAALEGGALTKGEFEATVKVERDKTSKELAGEFKPADLVPALIEGTKEAYMAIARSSNTPQIREQQKTNMKLDEIKKKLDFAEAKL